MSARIRGIGTAVPEARVSQERALELVLPLSGGGDRKHRLIAGLYRQSGIAFRHSVLLEETGAEMGQSFYPPSRGPDDRGPSTALRMGRYGQEAGPLALRSARRALSAAGISSRSITHLVTVSCTGFAAPGIDVELIDSLGLPRTTSRTHVGFMGCHGAMNGLRMANAVVEADPAASVLVTAVELCSLHQQYGWDRDRVVANALFADGAASVVVDNVSGQADDAPPSLLLSGTGSTVYPETRDLMGWKIGDHGFEMQLSARVPDTIRRNLGGWLGPWLEWAGLGTRDVGAWAVHPGGPKILTAAMEGLGLDEAAMAPSRSVLSDFGNMSSPTVLFIMERLMRQRVPGPWVVLGFGPGLAVEAALVRPSPALLSSSVRVNRTNRLGTETAHPTV